MITISSKKDGFRRCGVAHPAKATSYPDDKFSKEELYALRGEPMLVVVFTKDGEGGKAAPETKEPEMKEPAPAPEKAKQAKEGKEK